VKIDKLSHKLRWWIAELLDRRPNQCWADLVGWALNHDLDEHKLWKPSQPMSSACRGDAARVGSCYCGKLSQDPICTACRGSIPAGEYATRPRQLSARSWSYDPYHERCLPAEACAESLPGCTRTRSHRHTPIAPSR
jgi:hypothetical protein